MLTALDHVAIVVRDLQAATDRYTALLGCLPSSRGTELGAEHVWFQLDNVALDIIAPSGGDAGRQVQTRLDRHGEGIWSLAFATSDIAKARHILERRGVDSTEPFRQSILDAEQVVREWTTSVLSADATFGTTITLIERKPDSTLTKSTATVNSDSQIKSLDHVVVTTAQPERAIALYGARLGLDMKLDRTNTEWGSRLMFFKCGDLIVEVAHSLKNTDPMAADKAWGLSWRVADIAGAQARIAESGHSVSDVRTGRKPGTQVFTVRDAAAGIPTLCIGRT